MRNYITLAWRNIWRNKRRTLITAASIFFGVLLSAFMSSIQEGSYGQYIDTIVNSYSGYLQIHKKGYWEDKIINNSLVDDDTFIGKINQVKEITLYAPRLESFALASSDERTKGVMVMGIDPERENQITHVREKIIQGQYLQNGDEGVILGSGLAKYMNLQVNDTLILIGQGYHGASAAGKYLVRGIVKHPSPGIDRMLVYMDIKTCQMLYAAPGLITSMVLMVNDNDQLVSAKQKLIPLMGPQLKVMDWKEMNELLLKQIESDRAQGVITKGILYMIIAFGMLGTVMMMMAERRKEFGVLIAIGMRKYKLIIMLWLETLFMAMLGVITGIAASIPLICYFVKHPIPLTGQAGEMMSQMGFEPAMFFATIPSVFYDQALIIFVFSLVIGCYPMAFIYRLKLMKAIRN